MSKLYSPTCSNIPGAENSIRFCRGEFLRLCGYGIAGLSLVPLGACSAASIGGSSEGRRMLLAHNKEPGNPSTLAADRFAELVAEKSDGELEVQAVGGGQLGSDSGTLDSVQTGAIALTVNSQGPVATIAEQVGLLGLPFLFSSIEQTYEVLDGDIGRELAERISDRGLTLLSWWDNGIRHVTNNLRPVREPTDLGGMVIRTPDDPMTIAIFQSLSASPIPLDFNELYLALRQGTVDAQENPIPNIASSNLQEVQQYLSLTAHKYESTPLIVAQPLWEGLNDDERDTLQEAAEEAKEYQRAEFRRQTEELLVEFESQIEVNDDLDLATFREASQPVYDNYRREYSDFIDRLTSEVGNG